MKMPGSHSGRVPLTIRVDPNVYRALILRAEREQRTKTSVVEMALKAYMKEDLKNDRVS